MQLGENAEKKKKQPQIAFTRVTFL